MNEINNPPTFFNIEHRGVNLRIAVYSVAHTLRNNLNHIVTGRNEDKPFSKMKFFTKNITHCHGFLNECAEASFDFHHDDNKHIVKMLKAVVKAYDEAKEVGYEFKSEPLYLANVSIEQVSQEETKSLK